MCKKYDAQLIGELNENVNFEKRFKKLLKKYTDWVKNGRLKKLGLENKIGLLKDTKIITKTNDKNDWWSVNINAGNNILFQLEEKRKSEKNDELKVIIKIVKVILRTIKSFFIL